MPAILKRCLVAVFLTFCATLTWAQSEYRVQSGDTLLIEVLEDPSLNRSVVVLPDGRFSFPFSNGLKARGLTVRQIQASVTASVAPNFAATPTVFVAVNPKEPEPTTPAEPITIDVYFLGEVNTPGLREVAPETTFLQALSQSGGLTRFAATKRIQLRRKSQHTGQPTVFTYNYKALTRGASLQSDITLKDGDVILVPERRLFE